ncbi:MAG: hypothetical protein U9P44_04000 [archaeon]|nr:hypothetical protein [archaeon]
MDKKQLDIMVRFARENGNFQELRRLEKIVRLHDPNFCYSRYKKKATYFTESCFEKTKRNNSSNFNAFKNVKRDN